MNRNLFVLCLFLFSSSFLRAQQVTYSEGFEEPLPGKKVLMILKNGSTAYLNITADAIETRMYDKNGKLTGSQQNDHSLWTDRKMSASSFSGAYEINGQVILYYQQMYRGNVAVLHSIQIDPVSGKLIKSKELVKTEENSFFYPFTVFKDPLSNMQAALYYTDRNPKEIKAYKVAVFDENFNKVKEVAISGAKDSIITSYSGDFYNKEFRFFHTFKTAKSKSSKNKLILGILKDGSNEFEEHRLNVPVFADEELGAIKYNESTGLYQMISVGEISRDNSMNMIGATKQTIYYSTEQRFINPENFTVQDEKKVSGTELNLYAKKKLAIADGFGGVYDRMVVNADNSMAALYQEMSYVSTSHGTTTQAGNLGVTACDKNGNVTDAYVIQKAQVSGSAFMRNPFAINQYFVYNYFSTPSAKYVVFNDIPENIEKSLSEKPHTISTVSDANAILYKLSGGNIERSYLFGAPKDKRSSKYAMTGSMFYDKNAHKLVTMMVDNERGDKQAHLAWINIE